MFFLVTLAKVAKGLLSRAQKVGNLSNPQKSPFSPVQSSADIQLLATLAWHFFFTLGYRSMPMM